MGFYPDNDGNGPVSGFDNPHNAYRDSGGRETYAGMNERYNRQEAFRDHSGYAGGSHGSFGGTTRSYRTAVEDSPAFTFLSGVFLLAVCAFAYVQGHAFVPFGLGPLVRFCALLLGGFILLAFFWRWMLVGAVIVGLYVWWRPTPPPAAVPARVEQAAPGKPNARKAAAARKRDTPRKPPTNPNP